MAATAEIEVERYENGMILYQQPDAGDWVVRNAAGHWIATWRQVTSYYGSTLRGVRPFNGTIGSTAYYSYQGWIKAIKRLPPIKPCVIP